MHNTRSNIKSIYFTFFKIYIEMGFDFNNYRPFGSVDYKRKNLLRW